MLNVELTNFFFFPKKILNPFHDGNELRYCLRISLQL